MAPTNPTNPTNSARAMGAAGATSSTLGPRANTPPDDRAIETVLGPQLVLRLHGLLRSVRLYNVSNQAVQTQITQLLDSLGAVLEDEASLYISGEHFYLNGVRIKIETSQLDHFRVVAAEFAARKLGGLRFTSGLSRPEMETFVQMFAAAHDAAQGECLPEALVDAKVTHIAAVLAGDIAAQTSSAQAIAAQTMTAAGPARATGGAGGGGGGAEERARARTTFWRAVSGSSAALTNSARMQQPAMAMARRIVQPLVDTLMRDEYSILGLTALKNHDEYTYAHCVNVSLLSIAIGRRLGLPRTTLASLGVAALFHDLGKLAVPVEVLKKAGKLSDEEWRLVQRHPIEGVKLVSRHPGLTGLSIDAMRVCLQHHQTYDGGGYPAFSRPCRQSTLVRIVAAADCFDAMTGHRAYRRRPMTGFEALQQLVGREASHFDPAVLWGLVQCVGLYPAGTVMLTKSGHMVLAATPNPADARRPFCRVLRAPGQRDLAASAKVVWDPMPATEAVARVVPPEEIAVDVETLLGE
ncbi:MAG: HD-GYP domain-containing protein [bacterium]